ncbi:MAG: DUF1566 domain-containing protein [Myxococcaceae bacterium]|nr:DUF1566 domain-containing protein [Myxococcaceae bacterium]
MAGLWGWFAAAQRSAGPALVDGRGLKAALTAAGGVSVAERQVFSVVAVGDDETAPVAGAIVVEGTRQRRRWGAVVEQLEPSAVGFEHSYLVPERPRGALRVRLRPAGAFSVQPTRLEFAGSQVLEPLVAGAPVWVDADGRRTPLVYERDGDDVLLEVPRRVLEHSRYPAVLDPWLGPARAVEPPVVGHAFGRQESTVFTRGGSDGRSLLVWVDGRSGSDTDLFGAFVSSAGEVLDPNGIPLVAARGNQHAPSVAFDGLVYWVAYLDDRRSTSRAELTDLRVLRVSQTGDVLDPGGVVLKENPPMVIPQVLVVGGALQVAWERLELATYAIDLQRFDPVTLRATTPVIEVARRHLPIGARRDLRVHRVPGGVAHHWGGDVIEPDGGTLLGSFRRVVRDDLSLGPIEQLTDFDPGVSLPVTLPDGAAAVVFTRSTGTPWDGGASSFASPSFEVSLLAVPQEVDGGAAPLATATVLARSPSRLLPESAHGGPEGIFVSVLDFRRNLEGDVSLLRFDPRQPQPTSLTPVVRLPGWQWSSSVVAGAGGGALVAWSDTRQAPYDTFELSDVFMAFIGADGGVAPERGALVSQAPNSQRVPVVASRAEGSLVVWEDSRTGASDLYAMPLGVDGELLQDGGSLVSARTRAEAAPTIAAGPGGYLVVWEDTTESVTPDLWARRFDENGQPVGAPRALVTAQHSQRRPHLAANGSGYCLVWEDGRESADGTPRIYGAFLGPDGEVSPPGGMPMAPRQASGQDSAQRAPRCDWDGATWRVAHLDNRLGPTSTTFNLFLRRFSAEGTPQAGDVQVNVGPGTIGDFSLASRGDVALVAWTDTRVPDEPVVYAAVTVGGLVAHPDLRLSGAGSQDSQQRPVALALADRFLVAFEQRPTPDTSDLVGVWVGADGVIEPSRLSLASGTATESQVALANALTGRVTATWVEVSLDPRLRVERVMTRILRTGRTGQGCEAANECESGFCVEGVCCTSACEGGLGRCQSCLSGAEGPGVCSLVPKGTRCGPLDACGAPVTCDGVSDVCEAPAGLVCEAALPSFPPPPRPGCGCSGVGSSALLPFLLATLFTLRRRRRLVVTCLALAPLVSIAAPGPGRAPPRPIPTLEPTLDGPEARATFGLPPRAAEALASLDRFWRPDGSAMVAIAAGAFLRFEREALEVTLPSLPRSPLRLRSRGLTGQSASCHIHGPTLECASSGVVEVLENRGSGVEYRWHVQEPQRPTPMAVELDIEGRACATRGREVECLDELGAGLRVGAATWVDATGRRWPLETSLTPTGVRWAVPQTVVSQTRWPAVLDPIVTPIAGIRALDALQASANQLEVALAASPQRTLAAWIDERAESGVLLIAAVAADGTQAPSSLVRLPPAPWREHPSLAVDEQGRFLAVWAEADSVLGARRVMALLLDASGRAAWAGPREIMSGSLDARAPAVAPDAAGWLVAARLHRSGASPSLGLVTLNDGGVPGALVDGGPIAPFSSPQLAGDRRTVLVVAEIVRGAQVGLVARAWAQGALGAGREFVPASGDRLRPLVAVRPAGGFWLGSALRTAAARTLELEALGDTLDPLEPARILATEADGLGLASSVVAWTTLGTIHLRPIDPSGALGAEVTLARPGVSSPVALSTSPAGATAVWGERVGVATTLAAVRWAPPQPLGSAVPFARVGSTQAAPALIGFGENTALLVYEDRRSGRNVDLWGARVTFDGGVVDPSGTPVVQATGDQRRPSLAATGDLAMTAFVDTRTGAPTLWAARVSAQGMALDDEGIEVAPAGAPIAADAPVIAAARSFAVAAAAPSGAGLGVAEVSVLGRTGAGVRLERGSTVRRSPRLARLPAGFFLSWEATTDVATAGSDIVGTLLRENLSPIAPDGFALVTRPRSQRLRAVGGGDAGLVVVFEEDDGDRAAVFAAAVTPTGEPLGPVQALSVTDGLAVGASAAFVGDDALVVWRQARGGVDAVVARWVSVSALLASPPFELGEVTAATGSTAVTVDAAGRGVVAVTRFDDLVGADRIWLRAFEARPLGSSCTSGEVCSSGVCADGVCCDRACGTNACEACSVARGAARDGWCGPTPGRVCRGAADACDAEERCGERELTCPADGPAEDGAACGESLICQARACVADPGARQPVQPRPAGACSTSGAGGLWASGAMLCWVARRRRRSALAALVVLVVGCAPVVSSRADGSTPVDADAGPSGSADAGPVESDFGQPCSTNADCADGLCLRSGVCSRSCEQASDCPALPEWSCAASTSGSLFCQCVRQGAGEVCDGRDNDCDGVADDGATCSDPGTVCRSGQCVCADENRCDGRCVDRSSDREHCGACGVVCEVRCDQGQCACQAGRTLCAGRCVVLEADDSHCGACGRACRDGETCSGGACALDLRWARWPIVDAPRLTVTSAGTVVDLVTGLEWLRAPLPVAPATLDEAEQACAALRLQGRRDWRLPTRIELTSLLDYSRLDDPLWDVQALQGPVGAYWSASSRVFGAGRETWVVRSDGTLDSMSSLASAPTLVRCVR